jgi:hypothetical protein
MYVRRGGSKLGVADLSTLPRASDARYREVKYAERGTMRCSRLASAWGWSASGCCRRELDWVSGNVRLT